MIRKGVLAGQVFICILAAVQHGAECANTSVTCSHACFGTEVQVTCDINGDIVGSIHWMGTKEGESSVEVATCSGPDKCYPEAGYNVSFMGKNQILRILKFEETLKWTYKCQDNSDNPINTCVLEPLEPPVLAPELKAKCTKEGDIFVVTCYGVTEMGNPPVNLSLYQTDKVLSTSDSLKELKYESKDLSGETVTCKLIGAAKKCLEDSVISDVSVTCEGDSTGIITGVIVGVVVGICLIVGVIIFMCFKTKMFKNKFCGGDDVDNKGGENARGDKKTENDALMAGRGDKKPENDPLMAGPEKPANV